MSVPERYQSFRDRTRERFRRTFGGSSTSSTYSLPNNPLSTTGHPPQSRSVSVASSTSTLKPASAPENAHPNTVNVTWAGLVHFQQVLRATSGVFGPLKLVIDDLAGCIALHENAATARHDYQTLKTELEALFGILSAHLAGNMPQTMTASMGSLCSAIEKELDRISSKERGAGRRHWEANRGLDEVIECYRRTRGHLDRLTLNMDLSTWKIVDELATEARLDKLKPSMSASYNSREAAQVRRRECTPNTRKEVLSELSAWRHDQGQGNIFWLNGMAGTGKTTIATSLCKMLERTHELGASFFCSRQLPECRNVNLILPTIAYQLACFSRPFRFALSQVLERDPNVHTKALLHQLEGLIVGPLQEVARTLPTDLVVVIDALDECEDNDGVGQILELLVEHSLELPIKVFVSSRPESQIRQKIGTMRFQLVLHELDDKVVKGDIEIYLRAELAGISISEAQFADLVKRAGVLFIYAATVVRYIKAKDSESGQQERLHIVLGASSIPSSNKNKDIDALYGTVLATALNNPDLEEFDIASMRLALHTVVCVQEPLTVAALAGLLQLSCSSVLDALGPLWSVLHVSKAGGDGLVTALHASFPDYMLDPKRSKEYACDAALHHGRLAEQCFARIRSHTPQFNICQLESSYVLDEQVQGIEDRVKQAIPSDLAYACQYWAAHLELGGRSSERVKLLDEFLSRRLLLWMEVLNLRKRMNIGPVLLGRAKRWCDNLDGAVETKDLVHDSWRFVALFAANPVSRSTPHIYISMLASWPGSRPISGRYTPHANRLVSVTGTAKERRELTLLGIINAGAEVNSAALSADGMYIVSGCSDSKVRVWDAHSGEMLLGAREGHTSSICSVVFSPDGTRIASGSEDKTMRVWHTQSREMVLGPLEGHTGSVSSVAFSPDGMRIVSGSRDQTIRLWDAQSGEMVMGPLEGHSGPISSVVFSPDGTRIVSGSEDTTIRVWDARSGQVLLETLEMYTWSVKSVAVSPDGTCIVSGSEDNTIQLWDVQTGQVLLGPLEGHAGPVFSVTFSADGMRIISGSDDKTIRVWDARSGEMLLRLEGHIGPVFSAVFSPDNMRIVSGSQDQTIRMWDAQTRQTMPGPLEGHTDLVKSVAFSPDGTCIVSGSEDKTIQVWNSQSGEMVLGPLEGHTHSVCSVAFSPDGTRIVSGSFDKTIRVWDGWTGELVLGPLEGHTGWVYSVAFSPDGMHIVSGSLDKTLRVWNAQSGEMVVGPLGGHTRWVNSVVYSPDGICIASGSLDKTIRIWDAHSGELVLGPLVGHSSWVCSIAFSPDGMFIVSGSLDKTLRVWDAYNGEMVLGPLEGHTGRVCSVAFSPDSMCIVSGSEDKTIRVWDAHSGAMVLGPLHGHTKPVNSITFSPDGLIFVTGSDDETIRGWRMPNPDTSKPSTNSVSSATDTRNIVPELHAPPCWQLCLDGWVVDERQHLLLWVPHGLRNRLLGPQNKFMISTGGFVQLNFENASVGKLWTRCYLPAPPQP